MAAVTLEPGQIVLDYSFSRPDPDHMVAAGVKAVCRYIAGMNSATRPKILTTTERDRLWNAGLAIILNWEQDAGAPLQGGTVGKTHGTNCADMATGLDYPRTLPIAVSVDVGVSANQLPAIADYFYQFKAACPWPLTVYGGTYVGDYLVDAGFAEGIWQASASSWSPKPSPHVFLKQHYGVHYLQTAQWTAANQTDDNTVVTPFQAWSGLLTDAAVPQPKGKSMSYRVMRSDGAQFIVDDRGELNHLIDVQARFCDSTAPGGTGPRIPLETGWSDADIDVWWAQSEANRANRKPTVVNPQLPPPPPVSVDLAEYGLVFTKVK